MLDLHTAAVFLLHNALFHHTMVPFHSNRQLHRRRLTRVRVHPRPCVHMAEIVSVIDVERVLQDHWLDALVRRLDHCLEDATVLNVHLGVVWLGHWFFERRRKTFCCRRIDCSILVFHPLHTWRAKARSRMVVRARICSNSFASAKALSLGLADGAAPAVFEAKLSSGQYYG